MTRPTLTSCMNTTNRSSESVITVPLTRQPLEPWQIRFALRMRTLLMTEEVKNPNEHPQAKAHRQETINRLNALLAGNASR